MDLGIDNIVPAAVPGSIDAAVCWPEDAKEDVGGFVLFDVMEEALK